VKRRKALGYIWPRNCLLKHAIQGKIQERMEVKGRRGKNVSSYWITLRTTMDTGSRKRKH